jgi:hypothetical protein
MRLAIASTKPGQNISDPSLLSEPIDILFIHLWSIDCSNYVIHKENLAKIVILCENGDNDYSANLDSLAKTNKMAK